MLLFLTVIQLEKQTHILFNMLIPIYDKFISSSFASLIEVIITIAEGINRKRILFCYIITKAIKDTHLSSDQL